MTESQTFYTNRIRSFVLFLGALLLVSGCIYLLLPVHLEGNAPLKYQIIAWIALLFFVPLSFYYLFFSFVKVEILTFHKDSLSRKDQHVPISDIEDFSFTFDFPNGYLITLKNGDTVKFPTHNTLTPKQQNHLYTSLTATLSPKSKTKQKNKHKK